MQIIGETKNHIGQMAVVESSDPLVVDTRHPGFDMEGYFKGSWEAQIGYANLLLQHIIDSDEQVAILADV